MTVSGTSHPRPCSSRGPCNPRPMRSRRWKSRRSSPRRRRRCRVGAPNNGRFGYRLRSRGSLRESQRSTTFHPKCNARTVCRWSTTCSPRSWRERRGSRSPSFACIARSLCIVRTRDSLRRSRPDRDRPRMSTGRSPCTRQPARSRRTNAGGTLVVSSRSDIARRFDIATRSARFLLFPAASRRALRESSPPRRRG